MNTQIEQPKKLLLDAFELDKVKMQEEKKRFYNLICQELIKKGGEK